MFRVFKCHSVLSGRFNQPAARVTDHYGCYLLLRKVRVTAVLLLNVNIYDHVRSKARGLTSRPHQLLLIAGELIVVGLIGSNEALDLANVNESRMGLIHEGAATLGAPNA